MKFARLFLPGRFEDAYLYRGRLIALTSDRTIRAYNLDYVATVVENRIPTSRPWPKLLFTRNDWLASEQFLELTANQAVFDTLVAVLDSFPSPFVLDENTLPFTEHDLTIKADVLLDMHIYNGRLYVGANTGLYYVDLDWDESIISLLNSPAKRFDARCLSTSARFGAVNVSCGDEGLHTFFDEFGWAGGISAGATQRRAQTASQSYRTAWLDDDLVNYATYTDPRLLRSVRTRVDPATGLERESTILTDIEPDTNDLELVWDRLQDEYGIQRDDVQYAFNSAGALFVSTYDGHLYSVGITGVKAGHLDISYAKPNIGPREQILSATPSKLGLVVETESHVSLFARNQWQEVVEGEALAVRMFTQSRRYQNAVTVATEEGLWVVGMFDEHRPKSIRRNRPRYGLI